MTHPSYYDDPLAHSFQTTVAAIDTHEPFVVLAETLFYPEGGGQPADIGSIAGIPVTDVQKDESGTIRHYVDTASEVALTPGMTVTGTVDMAHRWEYMQQHTGQHVLSAALASVADAPTVSVHQGSDLTTIEVERETISEAILREVEDRANTIIRDDLSVRGFWIDYTELPNYALRRPTSRTGAIRLVEIDGVDRVACGGVHLPRTGLLNVIHLSSVERIRGRLRLGFKIGDRAIDDYRSKDVALRTAAEQFSAHPLDVPQRVASTMAEVQDLHRTRRIQARRIAEYLIEEAMRQGTAKHAPDEQPVAAAPTPPVTAAISTLRLKHEDPEIVSALAETAAERVGRGSTSICVLNETDDAIYWAIAVAVTPFPQQQLRTELLSPLGANGGGKPPLWRGVIKSPALSVAATADEFERRFGEVLRAITSD
ncbi:MAG TPA: alanyl-tRNA editing protein [Alkalispirochaeta sp.]|nr:alanyl-tRNA editing protein [Alkalispirochaeta sp.]